MVIPSEIEFMIAPIESERCYQRINFWKRKHNGLNFSALSVTAANTVYHHRVLKSELLATPEKMGSIELMNVEQIQEQLSLKSSHTIQRSGTLHGFVGWFRAHLYGTSFLTNDPLKKTSAFNWTQAFFPLPGLDKGTLSVKKNQKLSFFIEWNLKTNQLTWAYR